MEGRGLGHDGKHCKGWRGMWAGGSVGFKDSLPSSWGSGIFLPSSWGSGMLSLPPGICSRRKDAVLCLSTLVTCDYQVNQLYTQPSPGEAFPSQGEVLGKVERVFSLSTEHCPSKGLLGQKVGERGC